MPYFLRKSLKKLCERAVENSLKAIFSLINERISVRFDKENHNVWDNATGIYTSRQ